MHDFGNHVFSFINAQNDRHWVKSRQGIQSLARRYSCIKSGVSRIDEGVRSQLRWAIRITNTAPLPPPQNKYTTN